MWECRTKSTADQGARVGMRSQGKVREQVQSLPVDAQDQKFDKKTWQREYMREYRKGLRRRDSKENASD